MLNLSQVPAEVFLATFKEQMWQLKELQRRLKASTERQERWPAERWFESDARERILLALGAEYRKRLMYELRLEPGTEVYDDWRPFLAPLDPDNLAPSRVVPEGWWRQALEEEGLPEMLTIWAGAGFRTESLEVALRRFLEDNRDRIQSVALDHVLGPVRSTISQISNQLELATQSRLDVLFRHDDSYRNIHWSTPEEYARTGELKRWSLTPSQAAIIGKLHTEWEKGFPDVKNEDLVEAAGLAGTSDARNSFHGKKTTNKELWGDTLSNLIIPGRTKGSRRLNLCPDDREHIL